MDSQPKVEVSEDPKQPGVVVIKVDIRSVASGMVQDAFRRSLEHIGLGPLVTAAMQGSLAPVDSTAAPKPPGNRRQTRESASARGRAAGERRRTARAEAARLGLTPEQHIEQLIIAHIEGAAQPVSRPDLEQATCTTTSQARKVLQKLVTAGRVTIHGKKRWTAYGLTGRSYPEPEPEPEPESAIEAPK